MEVEALNIQEINFHGVNTWLSLIFLINAFKSTIVFYNGCSYECTNVYILFAREKQYIVSNIFISFLLSEDTVFVASSI